MYPVSQGAAIQHIKVEGRKLSLIAGGNAFMAKEPKEDFEPGMYFDFPLFDYRLEYTVDLSKVGCSCNAALYFLKMPGYDAAQQPDPSDWKNYYCDADQVAGQFCPDMDVAEANRYTMASTAHKCDKPEGKHYSNCDKVGCGTNMYDTSSTAMCPEEKCIINTQKPYTHRIDFIAEDGKLAQIKNSFLQEDRVHSFSACQDKSYMEQFSDDTKQLVMTMSLWGNSYDTMKWLDGMTGCTGACDIENSAVSFSDFKFTSLKTNAEIEID